jgi:hypothetical protein
VVVLLAAFMDFIDVTIVVIAAPVIQADLGASYAGVQWLLAGYTLPFGLLLVLYPLIQGNDLGWPAWTWLMTAAALPVLAAFVWYERRQQRRGLLPLVPVSLLRRRSFGPAWPARSWSSRPCRRCSWCCR